MGMTKIVEDAWRLSLGSANAILLRDGDELTLIDTGWPGKEHLVFDAIAKLDKRPSDLKHVVLTHGHSDHIGSAAAVVRATGARTNMHAADVALAESGGPFRPMTPSPGLVKRIEYRLIWRPDARVPPFRVDQHIADGETMQVAGGLRAIHVPGHCAGQVALIWRDGRLLKLAGLAFEAVVFGHGPAITRNAAARVRQAAERR